MAVGGVVDVGVNPSLEDVPEMGGFRRTASNCFAQKHVEESSSKEKGERFFIINRGARITHVGMWPM